MSTRPARLLHRRLERVGRVLKPCDGFLIALAFEIVTNFRMSRFGQGIDDGFQRCGSFLERGKVGGRVTVAVGVVTDNRQALLQRGMQGVARSHGPTIGAPRKGLKPGIQPRLVILLPLSPRGL